MESTVGWWTNPKQRTTGSASRKPTGSTSGTTNWLNQQSNQPAQPAEQPTGSTSGTTNRLNQHGSQPAQPAEQPTGSTSGTTNRLNQRNNQLSSTSTTASWTTSATSRVTNRLSQQNNQPAQPAEQPTGSTSKKLTSYCYFVNNIWQSVIRSVNTLFPSATLQLIPLILYHRISWKQQNVGIPLSVFSQQGFRNFTFQREFDWLSIGE